MLSNFKKNFVFQCGSFQFDVKLHLPLAYILLNHSCYSQSTFPCKCQHWNSIFPFGQKGFTFNGSEPSFLTVKREFRCYLLDRNTWCNTWHGNNNNEELQHFVTCRNVFALVTGLGKLTHTELCYCVWITWCHFEQFERLEFRRILQ
jgi:hypothetical protein